MDKRSESGNPESSDSGGVLQGLLAARRRYREGVPPATEQERIYYAMQERQKQKK